MEIIITSPGVPYPKIGYCIYCGDAEDDPTLEHIIARGLGGNHTLPKASCEDCQKRINKVETYCQHKMFGALRIRLGLSNTAPEGTFPLSIVSDDGNVETLQRTPRDYPRMLSLGCYPEPGILVGRPPWAPIQPKPWLGIRGDDEAAMRSTYGGQGYLSPEFHPAMFFRMLAKIGLAAAAAIVRLENFTPLVRDLIRNGSDHQFYWTGGGLDKWPPQEVGVAHWLSLGWEREYLVASIRLFAFLGTPVYRVVVGERLKNEPAPIQKPLSARQIEILFELGKE